MEKQLLLFEKLDDHCLKNIYSNLECRAYKIMTGTSRDDECESCFAAARNGHAQCLKFLHETNSPWDAITCNAAATHGNFECLRYAHENGCPWDKWTCTEAAENGHLECLKYARENGCPWDKMGSHGNEVWPHRLRRLGDQKWLP